MDDVIVQKSVFTHLDLDFTYINDQPSDLITLYFAFHQLSKHDRCSENPMPDNRYHLLSLHQPRSLNVTRK